MLSDEEKKAIIELKHYSSMSAYWKQEEYTNNEIDNYIKILLNLIEQQSKEIEVLKDKFSDKKIRDTVIKRYREVIEKDYISKDKIKAIIEELQEDIKYSTNPLSIDNSKFGIKVLQSLLKKEE